MKTLKILGASLATALLLAACGGGATLSGNATGPTKTSGTTSVTVTANPATIATDGSTTATVTAVARDVNNAGVAGVVVTFGASTGLISPSSATTDTTGSATATLSAAGVAGGTNITVAAAVGTIQGSTTVGVVAIQQSLSLTTSTPQIPSDSSSGATISALLKDANNNVLPGIKAQFTSTSGAVTLVTTPLGAAANPPVPAGTTDANGVAAASVTAGNDPTDRRITVTVAAGSAPSATIPLEVNGTSLTFSGPSNLVVGSKGTYLAILVDSSLKGIANTPVALSSANNNTLVANSVMTDSNGKAVFTVIASSVANNGKDVLTATALGQTQTASLLVSSDVFTFTSPANDTTKVDLGFMQPVVANWKSNGLPKVGQNVTFSATRGTLSAASAMTDANGNASVTISSNTAGQSVIDADGTGVSAQALLDFIATSPTQIALQVSPASIPVQGTSTVTATVRDVKNNLVEGVIVDFAVTDSTGGRLSSAAVTTDVQGRASTTYTAGNTTSAGAGVIVFANVPGTTASSSATLTVGGQSVFLSLGTGNQVDILNEAQYQKQFAVQAVDAQGAALANVPLTVKVLPVAYGKGYFQWDTNIWVQKPSPTVCPNEDTDYTGNINSLPNKDFNGNGKLDPGNVATASPSSGSTNSVGTLIALITYPKDHAYWVEVTLTATTVVAGTESSVSATFWLPGAVTDYTTETVAPPGEFSPYGLATTCANPN